MTPEQRKAKQARWQKWYAEHREQHREYRRGYVKRNREKVNAKLREWRARRKAEKPEFKVEQPELIPSKRPVIYAHRAYPPFGKCPCRECRAQAAQERERRALTQITATQRQEIDDECNPI